MRHQSGSTAWRDREERGRREERRRREEREEQNGTDGKWVKVGGAGGRQG